LNGTNKNNGILACFLKIDILDRDIIKKRSQVKILLPN
jgi:hypothetical protein